MQETSSNIKKTLVQKNKFQYKRKTLVQVPTKVCKKETVPLCTKQEVKVPKEVNIIIINTRLSSSISLSIPH